MKGTRDEPAVRNASTGRSIPTIWVFAVLASANLAAALYLNGSVLTDEVYRSLLSSQGSHTQIEAFVSMTRRWERLGYAIGPLALFARIGVMALLVQLALAILGRPTPIAHVFRAGTLAQYAVLLGTLTQVLWLASLPPAGRTLERVQGAPGSVSGLLFASRAVDPHLALLFDRITVFDLGWMALFVLALEDSKNVSGSEAAASVLCVWMLGTLTQWGFWLFMAGLS